MRLLRFCGVRESREGRCAKHHYLYTHKEVTNSPPSSATPLKSMVTSLGRSSAEPASLALSGTSPLQSLPSSWPPRNTSPARSPVTPTMTPTMTLPQPMNQIIELSIFRLLGKRTGYLSLFLFMFPPALCFLQLHMWRACSDSAAR